jgi:hypothetical protein
MATPDVAARGADISGFVRTVARHLRHILASPGAMRRGRDKEVCLKSEYGPRMKKQNSPVAAATKLRHRGHREKKGKKEQSISSVPSVSLW